MTNTTEVFTEKTLSLSDDIPLSDITDIQSDITTELDSKDILQKEIIINVQNILEKSGEKPSEDEALIIIKIDDKLDELSKRIEQKKYEEIHLYFFDNILKGEYDKIQKKIIEEEIKRLESKNNLDKDELNELETHNIALDLISLIEKLQKKVQSSNSKFAEKNKDEINEGNLELISFFFNN